MCHPIPNILDGDKLLNCKEEISECFNNHFTSIARKIREPQQFMKTIDTVKITDFVKSRIQSQITQFSLPQSMLWPRGTVLYQTSASEGKNVELLKGFWKRAVHLGFK